MSDQIPLSRPIRVDSLPKEGIVQSIEANPTELGALAELNNVPQITKLSATMTLKRAGRGSVRVTGQVHAELTQKCVVSLERFAATVDEPIDARFAPPRRETADKRRASTEMEVFGLEDEDEPDAIIDGRIDIGALAAEFFALGLDPYPRKPGAAFSPSEVPATQTSAFRALGEIAKAKR